MNCENCKHWGKYDPTSYARHDWDTIKRTGEMRTLYPCNRVTASKMVEALDPYEDSKPRPVHTAAEFGCVLFEMRAEGLEE
jgi:hypothetical protein